jgi:KipI family sensor histidine kinase inhibitor
MGGRYTCAIYRLPSASDFDSVLCCGHYGRWWMAQKTNNSSFQGARIRPYGERGYLLDQLSELERVAIEQALSTTPPDGFDEYVIGAENLLVLFQRPTTECVLHEWLADVGNSVLAGSNHSRRIEVPVRYDGPDLATVAAATGLSEAEVVAIHSAPEYRVRMMGFAPGFPYLDGLDERLHLDRKASPRDRIEPGAVAIGGSHAGIYSVASPGGWHLLGRTELPLFQPEHARGTVTDVREVFALSAGDTVKFVVI